VANWLYPKLKPGPGRTSDEVHASQRARLRTAMVELCAEHGYEGVKVRALARLARVSTGTFYKHFTNAEDCFADTYDSLMQAALSHARAAQSQSDDWEAGLRAVLHAVLDCASSHPHEARLVLVEAYALGPGFYPRIDAAFAGFERLLFDSFARAPHEVTVHKRIMRGMVAGIARVARTQLPSHRSADVSATADQLHDWILALCREQTMPFEPFARSKPTTDITGTFGDERRRILAAAVKLARTGGYSSLTVSKVRAEAAVSRRRLDAYFDDVADCFLEAVQELALSAAAGANRQRADAIGILWAEIAAEPATAQLVFVEILAPGRKGLERRERLVSLAAQRFGSADTDSGRSDRLAAEASAAGAWAIAEAEVRSATKIEPSGLALLLTHVVRCGARLGALPPKIRA
jgi:AcrR family transcriptional regulator